MTAKTTSGDLLTQHGVVWRRAAILAIVCVALAAVVSSDVLHAALLQVLAAGEETIARRPLSGMVFFVVFAALSAMFAFVSVAVFSPVAVFTWGKPLSILLLWLGWMVGGALSYGIGRLLGRVVVRWLTSSALLRRLERRVQRNSSFGLVLLLQLALPSEIPGYVLGLVRYRFPTYLLALGLAELPYTVATIYLGSGFIERRSGVVLAVGVLLILLSVGAFYGLKRFFSAAAEGPGA